MGGGIPMPGQGRPCAGPPDRRLQDQARDYLDQVTAPVRQDIVDLILLSVSNLERLVSDGAFRDSRVATAIRANDTTDIWGTRHGGYLRPAVRPFRSTTIDHIHVRARSTPPENAAGADRPRPVLHHAS